MTEREELARLAAANSVRPWFRVRDMGPLVSFKCDRTTHLIVWSADDDSPSYAYIAAASPEAILGLLEEVRSLREHLDFERKRIPAHATTMHGPECPFCVERRPMCPTCGYGWMAGRTDPRQPFCPDEWHVRRWEAAVAVGDTCLDAEAHAEAESVDHVAGIG